MPVSMCVLSAIALLPCGFDSPCLRACVGTATVGILKLRAGAGIGRNATGEWGGGCARLGRSLSITLRAMENSKVFK